MSLFDTLAVVGAVMGGIFAPLAGVATIYINRKFDLKSQADAIESASKDQKIANLEAGLKACEDRHKANDAVALANALKS